MKKKNNWQLVKKHRNTLENNMKEREDDRAPKFLSATFTKLVQKVKEETEEELKLEELEEEEE
jgi:hypothetical protein